MFLSASVGFCGLAAIIRGLRGDPHMGNYYLDMWRVVAYTFVPASLVMGVLLLADGVPMTLDGARSGDHRRAGRHGAGRQRPAAAQQQIARGPVAAIIPIKHLGTNGGGFFGANSAHPLREPQRVEQLPHGDELLPVPLRAGADVRPHVAADAPRLGDLRRDDGDVRARLIGWADLLGHAASPNPRAWPACRWTKAWATWKARNSASALPPGPTFAAATTAISCGSVNCAHDSLNPLAGLTPADRHVAQLHLRRQGRGHDQPAACT